MSMLDMVSPVLAISGVGSIFVVIGSIIWLYLGYRWWAGKLDRKLIQPREEEQTPAVRLRDGLDYYPAKPLVLFGHHFSSIAGAGPIIGPILACAWFGWGPTLLWIFFGTIFFGAVHDYTALMISVRNDGKSLPDVARDVVGSVTRVLFMVFVWIALVVVITAFGIVTRKTFIQKPEIVLPTFALIPLAILFGLAVYRFKVNLGIATVLAFAILLGLLYVGCRVPVTLSSLPDTYGGLSGKIWFSIQLGLKPETAKTVWFIALLGYGFVASVLPVWLLLQPRDYIAAWLLFLGIILGTGGIFVSNKPMYAPAFVSFNSAGVGPIWPMLFIIVACGAISGFHSIVAGGTSSKQLANEKDGRKVGYGAMVVEGLLAVIALLAVAAGLKYSGSANSFMGIMKQGKSGAIVAFGTGFGSLTEPLLKPVGTLLGISMLGTIFGIVLVNAFVMTTLDTTVRLTRFIGSELLGDKIKLMKNRFVASFVAVFLAYLLSITGTFAKIWPIFGASNQLLAALALIIATAYFVKKGKPKLYTLVPAVFMVLTTMAALAYQAHKFLIKPKNNPGWKQNLPLGITSIVLFLLALVVVVLAWKVVFRKVGEDDEQPQAATLEEAYAPK